MQKAVINKFMNFVDTGKYSKTELEKIKYGFECIYILISKSIIVFTIAYFLGILKYTLLFALLFGLIRIFAGGLHATSSFSCLVASTILFMVLPYLSNILVLNSIIRFSSEIISIILLIIYAPADTKKRPIISKKKRLRLKITATTISIIYLILNFFIKNNGILNLIMLAMVLETILILPITYKLFKLPYNNYIYYLKSHKLEGGL